MTETMSRQDLEKFVREECAPMLPILAAVAPAFVDNPNGEMVAARFAFNTYRALHDIALQEVLKPVQQGPNIESKEEFFPAAMEQGPPKDAA